MIPYGRDYPDPETGEDRDGTVYDGSASGEDDAPLRVVPFPVLDDEALQGAPGDVVNAVMPYTEAHPAAVLADVLARYGATIGADPHVRAANTMHPARLWPLIVGPTSTGAKGTSADVGAALFAAVERNRPDRPKLIEESGLSTGEGLIECLRDANGDDPNAKGFDEGVIDKRLLVVEEEFTSLLAVMERKGSIMPRVLRSCWDGKRLRSLTRNSPLVATGAHVVVITHVTPGELRIKLSEAQMVGGTMNRFIPVASRRTKLLADGGNLPEEILDEFGGILAHSLDCGWSTGRVERSPQADKLWHDRYPELRKDRPDGPVASILARAVPQVLRLSLAYALADGCQVIEEQHLSSALALWRYAEATAEWMFGAEPNTSELDPLVRYIASAGRTGRSRTQILSEHFQRNKKAAEVDLLIGQLVSDGRVRQETVKSPGSRSVTRYYAA